MKKLVWLLSVMVFVIVMGMNSSEAKEQVSVANEEAYESFCLAGQEYEAAKYITDPKERDIVYAKAIGDISRAVNTENPQGAYFLLGSQIYRSKGVIAYAKQYFLRAEQRMQMQLEKNPDSSADRLDYAIACYAGDVRFWSEYPQYKEKARWYAQQVLDIGILKEKLSRRDFLHMAMASLILGDRGICDEFMLIAQYGIENVTEEDALADECCELYNNTVAQNTWLWNVREESIDKEFLLHYLTMKAVFSG